MLQKLLVAIDQGEATPHLIAAVSELRGGFAIDVIVVHVRERRPRGATLLSKEDAARLVDRTVAALRRSGIHASGRLMSCLPRSIPQALIEVAEEEDADAIVVGTYRRWRLTRWLQGSVSRGLIARAEVPVFTVPVLEDDRRHTPDRKLTAGRPAKIVALSFQAGRHRPSGT